MLITVNVQHDFTSAAVFAAFSVDLEALIAKYSGDGAPAPRSPKAEHAKPSPLVLDPAAFLGADVPIELPPNSQPLPPNAALPVPPLDLGLTDDAVSEAPAPVDTPPAAMPAPEQPAPVKAKRGRKTNAERAAIAAAAPAPETSVPSFPAAQSQGAVKQHAPEAPSPAALLAAHYEGVEIPEKLDGVIVGKLGLARLLNTVLPDHTPESSAPITNAEAIRILKKYGVVKSRFLKAEDCKAALADFLEAAERLAAGKLAA